ncbi:MAG: 4Fe-4S binding protein [Bacteroidales bacterium]|nr:4Fe-4S binding protein [Bacteroidales bacterium]
MLRAVRIVLALLMFASITLLFLDLTGVASAWLGWTAKIQLLPAILAGNVVAIIIVAAVTLLFGRVYCSVACPLGVMQDLVARFSPKRLRHTYRYTQSHPWLRWGIFAVFVVLLLLGLNSIALLIAPYSAYGRIASQLLQPLAIWGNNAAAAVAQEHGSYVFHTVPLLHKGGLTLIVAIATLLVVGIMAFVGGRTWCNNICPVGTLLGWLSKYSLLKPHIDQNKCVQCHRCEKRCKAGCIDIEHKTIDHSRCVACMNCTTSCKVDALHYSRQRTEKADLSSTAAATTATDTSRRKFITTTVAVATSSALAAQEMKVDGGLAVILDKKVPARNTAVKPAGSISLKHFAHHCTACQLCVAECPNHVLRPSKRLDTLMQPEMSFEQGYCRPECTRCSTVCPTGAIRPITPAEKTNIHWGHAVWIAENCIANTDNIACGNCERHCPVGAIIMVPNKQSQHRSPAAIPTVDESRCIGCGACENLCPSRPISAIYVEGRETHVQS